MTLVFMFPGQSSRYPEMLDRIIEAYPPGREIVAEASDALGRDLVALYREGEGVFERNRDVQVGVFVTSHLHRLALEARGIDADLSLGLSLGEYTHLVHAGALDFASALALVDARGRVYDDGPRGMMAAVFPVELEELEPVVLRAAPFGVVEIANHNSPNQFVVAGEAPAVEEVMRLCDEELAAQPVVIERQIPMHTSVFRGVADALEPHLQRAPWRRPQRAYVSNVVGGFVEDAVPERIVELMRRHVYSPVRWRQSIDAITERHSDAAFVEVGPRGVLYNMLQKRWHPNRKYKTDVPGDLAANFDAVADALRDVGVIAGAQPGAAPTRLEAAP